ncbi:TetR/AcrR family transcriptional regulator [Mycolicibacillus trivialis]
MPVRPTDVEADPRPTRRRGRPPVENLREDRRAQIIASALAVFAEKGYEATTVSDIARHAGIGQGTIYRYIGSKRELLDLVFDHSVEELMGAAQPELLTVAQPTGPQEFLDRAEAVLTAVDAALDRQPQLLSLVLVEASAIDEELKLRILGLEATVARIAAGLFDQAQEAGLLRPGADPEVCGVLATKLLLPGGLREVMGQRDPAIRARYRAAVIDFVRRGFFVERDPR